MKTKVYTALGFAAWQGIKLVVRRKLSQKKATVAAAATVALVALAGVAAAKAGSTDE